MRTGESTEIKNIPSCRGFPTHAQRVVVRAVLCPLAQCSQCGRKPVGLIDTSRRHVVRPTDYKAGRLVSIGVSIEGELRFVMNFQNESGIHLIHVF